MRVKLRKMNSQEFDSFCEYSINDYAKDLMKEQEITLKEALSQAKNEFSEMLPEGSSTKDNSLMMIEEVYNGKAVGVIWYLYEMTEGTKQVFLNDFMIYEEERRKGYAMEAINKMIQMAKEDGCTESIIYVWKHNPPGIYLYTKCGYSAFREQDDGMYMKKEIQ